MPLTLDSLAALSELSGRGGSRPPVGASGEVDPSTESPLPRVLPQDPASHGPGVRRGALLAAGAVVAGLVCGLVVPVASAQSPSGPSPVALAPVVGSAPALAERAVPAAPSVPAGAVAAFATAPAVVFASPLPAPTARTTPSAAAVATPSRSASVTRSAPPAPPASAAPAAPEIADLSSPSIVQWVPEPGRAGAVRAGVAGAISARVSASPSPAAVAPTSLPARPRRALPPDSGTGRRIVYAQRKGHLWVVGADGTVLRDYPVTGRIGRPKPGTYQVFSKSPTSVNPIAKVRFDLMVRFAHGVTGAAIGFHTIPRWYDGRPLQTERQLGSMIGAGGCVRQSQGDAEWLYSWVRVGDDVVVLR